MEHKQFTSDDLSVSTHSNQGFQMDRFTKRTSQLNIPDTIQEHYSAEFSTDSLKMEVPKITINYFNGDDKENINTSQQFVCNESLNKSTNFEIDNSYIRQCERKLLESSNSDDERSNEFGNRTIVNSQLLKVSGSHNDTISTPPSLLRKEINVLRTEMAEADEFHDLEIQLLKEEKFLNAMDPENNAELLEKYSTLMELYTNLKTSYDEYRKAQEKMGREFQSKTADCLETLCSQIEASDNSLNFSTASFVSFGGGIRSSTMMEDVSEVEATVLHEATVLAHDPLSITCDGTFKTPSQTPIRSVKNLFPSSSITKPKEAKGSAFESEHNIQLLNLETALYDKEKEVKELERRLFKVEDMSTVMQNEFERISLVFAKENNTLKESLSSKTEQLNEMTEKLFTETISLDPSLKDALVDAPGKKLLHVFMETIMDKCKKIKGDEDTLEEDLRKRFETLEEKLSHAENTVLTRDEEIRLLQSHLGDVRQTREHLAETKEALSELESRLTFEEAEKKAAETRCFELEATIRNLNREIEAKTELLLSADEEKTKMADDNSRLKELYEGLQLSERKLTSELITIRESLTSADVTIEGLKSQLVVMEEEKLNLQTRCSELQEAYQKIENDTETEKEMQLRILELEETIAKLKTELESSLQCRQNNERRIEEFFRQIEQLNADKSDLTKILENVEESQKNISELLEEIDAEFPGERIEKLIENTMGEFPNGRDHKIITGFAETITKTCKGLRNELIKKFEKEKHEWETQRDLDLDSIKNLKDEINSLLEKRTEYETRFNLEKDELLKVQENILTQLAESEKVISTQEDEIKSREEVLKQTKETLATVDDTIEQLKSQLTSAEAVKTEMDHRCQELEQIRLDLRADINAKEAAMKEMDEFKSIVENENGDLKRKIHELKEEIEQLKTNLQTLEEEQNAGELSQTELKKEDLSDLTQKLENLERNNKNLTAVITEVQTCLKVPEDILSIILSGDVKNVKIFAETIDNLIKTEREDLEKNQTELQHLKNIRSDLELKLSESEIRVIYLERALEELKNSFSSLETKLSETQEINSVLEAQLEELKNGFGNLEAKLSEAQERISEREEEIRRLQLNAAQTQEAKTELESQLSEAETQITDAENRCRELERTIENLNREISDRENTQTLLENQKTDAENRLRELEQLTENLKLEIDSNKKTRTELQMQLSLAEEKKLELENQKAHLTQSNETLKAQLTEAENAFSQCEEEIRVLKSNETSLEKNVLEIIELKKSCQSLESKLFESNSAILAREEKIQKLESDMAQAQEHMASVIKAKEIELDKLKEVCSKLETKLSEMEKTNAALETKKLELEELKLVCSNLETKLSEALYTNSALEAKKLELEGLIEVCSNLETKLSESEKTNTALEAKKLELEELKEVCSNLETKLSEAQEINTALEAKKLELEELKQVCSNLEKKLSEVQETVSDLEAKQIELEGLKEVCNSLQTKITEADKTISDLQSELSEAEKTISEQEEELRVLHSHVTQTRGEFTATKTILTELESQLAAAEIQKTEAETRYRELEKTIENLHREIAEKDNLQTENLRLKESFESLKRQMSETEGVISVRDEEIRELKTYEHELASAKESLAFADETILKLKTLLQSVESEKSEIEIRCTELQESNQNLKVEASTAKNLEKIQIENGDLKGRILESERMMSELKSELEVAKRDQMSNICKVEELIREIEELKRENDGFSCALSTIEETQKNLADMLSHPANDSDLPSDRITRLMQNLPVESTERREKKIVSDFVETITKTCKGVQNELIKKFDDKKLQWETQKDFDIRNLLEKINHLNEKNTENEAALKRTKHELTEADEAILKLKTQLSSTEVEKVEIELRVRKLEENNLNLQAEIDTKETILKGMDELKIVRQKIENENGDLRQKIVESEEVIIRLKKTLEIVKEEQNEKDAKIKDSENVIEQLKKENAGLTDLVERLENLEQNNRNLRELIGEVQTHLDISENTIGKILSGEVEKNKIFSESINNLIKAQTEGLKSENKHLKLGNDSLKERVKQLTKLIGATAAEAKEELTTLNASLSNSISLRSKSGRKSDMCARRLDKLEEINHNLTELINRMLTMTEFPDPDKLKLYSVREFPNVMKKVIAHMNGLEEKMKEVKEENAQLDEECETYANIIKDLKKEAAAVWKTNKEKTEQMEAEISRLKEEKKGLEDEKKDLLAKITKLDAECQKMKSSKNEGATNHNCACGTESKKINELKRTILLKEQKLLELQDLEAQTSSYKSQIEYLKNALEREKKKIGEEKEKNKKLRDEVQEAKKGEERRGVAGGGGEDREVLEELRMRGSLSGGVVQEVVEKEKMRKLAKDIGILKELCRARYAEIKRLEAENVALKTRTPKNSNQMDSPIRTRGYNTRSKLQGRDFWKSETAGKENNNAP